MEVYLIIVFIVILCITLFLIAKEYKVSQRPKIEGVDLKISINSNVPFQEINRVTYAMEVPEVVNYNEALVIEVLPPVRTNTWSIEVYDDNWELVGTEVQGFKGNDGETVSVVFTKNSVYLDEIKLSRNSLSSIISYNISDFDPDKKYRFVLRVPDTAYIDIKVYKLVSYNIGLNVYDDVNPLKKYNFTSERKIISSDMLENGFNESINRYGTYIRDINVSYRENVYSKELSYTTDKFYLNEGERLVIFYIDHSTSIGSRFSRVTIYDENLKPIRTDITGKYDVRSHKNSGLKCGIIDIDTPGEYIISEKIGPLSSNNFKISNRSVIQIRCAILESKDEEFHKYNISINRT